MFIENIKKINKKFIDIQQYIMIGCSLLISGMIFLGAIMRYVFKTDFYGLEELVMIFAFWLYFLGSSIASYEDSHINAELLQSYVHNKKAKKVLKAIKYAVTLSINLLVTYWGYSFIMWSIQMNPKTPVFKLPILLSQAPIFISLVLMSFYTLGHLIKAINEINTKS